MVLGQCLGDIHESEYLRWDGNEIHGRKRRALMAESSEFGKDYLSVQILKSLRINARVLLEILIAS